MILKIPFRQWNENEYFCCHDPNPPLGNNCTAKFPDTFKDKKDWIVHRETCGVPHSCCITKNETMRNLQCGDTLQDDVILMFSYYADEYSY